jgi:hypothetical protein
LLNLFLNFSANLKQYVPKDLFSKQKPNDWESQIFKAHASNSGKSEEDAKTEYLDIVKQWPFYGTTFYPPCKTIGARRIPNRVIIGVNAEGILLLKKDKVFAKKHDILHSLGISFHPPLYRNLQLGLFFYNLCL